MDEQIMSWAVQRPEDWQLGGRCEAFMWGGGRIGQLGEAGRTVLSPTVAQSFCCAQQVRCNHLLSFITPEGSHKRRTQPSIPTRSVNE